MKKYIFFFLILSILLIGNSMVCLGVSDLKDCSTYSKTAVQYLSDRNFINGDKKGNFYPKKEVSRAEFVTMLVNALGNIDTSKFEYGYDGIFKDITDKYWAKKYIIAAQQNNLVSGVTKDTFEPNGKITREQMASILSHLIVASDNQDMFESHRIINELKDKASLSGWAKSGVEISLAARIMEGTGAGIFSPKSKVTKEQAAVVLYKYLNTKKWFDKYLYLYSKNLKPVEGDYFTLDSSDLELYKVIGKNSGSKTILVDSEIRVTGTENDGIKVSVTTVFPHYLREVSYGNSKVYFNGPKVIGWENNGNLKVNTGIPKTNTYFTYGSTKEELFEAMGTPKNLIVIRDKVYATYNEGFVELQNNKVTAWVEEVKGGLRLGLGKVDPAFKGFSYDSSFGDVVKAMGAPLLLYKGENQIVMQYGKSFVYLYNDFTVKNWSDKGELKLAELIKDENAPPFTFGFTRGQVIKAMGKPDSISLQYDAELGLNFLYWLYGSSRIHFDEDFRVDGWLNNGNLKLPATEQNAIPVEIGTSKKEILDTYGTPDYVSPFRLKYGHSLLKFSFEDKLIELVNTDRNIRVSRYDYQTNEDFTIGASLDEVLKSMGHPDKMEELYQKIKLYYGSSELYFADNKLIGYVNTDKNLRINMGERKPDLYFNMLSTLNELVDAMGTPDSIIKNEFGQYVISYDKSIIKMDYKNNYVGTWDNISNNLRLEKSVVEGTTITLGAPITEVLRTMGAPDSFDDVGYIGDYGECYSYKMKYGKSIVLAGPGKSGELEALGWVNNGELKLDNSSPASVPQAISLGYTVEQVIKLKGLPNILYRELVYPLYSYRYIFEYEKTKIEFDEYNKVSSIYNGNNDILIFDDSPKLPGGTTVDFDASKQEIRDVLGDPVSISNSSWQYSDGLMIIFSSEGKISSFYGNYGKISMGTKQEGAPEISAGSTLDDVVKAYGTPERCIYYNASGTKLILIYQASGDEEYIYQGKAYRRLDINIDFQNQVKFIDPVSPK